VQQLRRVGQTDDPGEAARLTAEALDQLDQLARADTDTIVPDIEPGHRGYRPDDFSAPLREARDLAADLGIPADQLEHTASVEGLPSRSRALAGKGRDLAATATAGRDLARDVDLGPCRRPERVRETAPPVRSRSIARDLGLAEDALVPVERLREADARRSALVDRWRRLERQPVTDATALDFVDSLRELADIARLAA
jgi:hypothetical protein